MAVTGETPGETRRRLQAVYRVQILMSAVEPGMRNGLRSSREIFTGITRSSLLGVAAWLRSGGLPEASAVAGHTVTTRPVRVSSR